MKLYKYLLFVTGLLLSSCEYDYDINEHFKGEFTPKVVVNSIITPDSTIKAKLYWSKYISDTTSRSKVVENYGVTLYEDNNKIFEGDGVNGILTTNIHPKAGSKYRLEVVVPDYGELSAETSIPTPPSAEIAFVGIIREEVGYEYGGYIHLSIDQIVTTAPTRSIMIKSRDTYEMFPEKNRNHYYFYTDNPFCDKFNAGGDSYEASLKGSSSYIDYYMRVPYKNIELVTPLKFSVRNVSPYIERKVTGTDSWGFPIIEYIEHFPSLEIELIAPSFEYDKYYKTAYQQVSFGSVDPQIFSTIYSVHSNITNGIGIFAGYSSNNQIIDYNEDK